MGIDYYSYPPHVSRSEYLFMVMETLMVNISLMLLCPYDVMPFFKKENSFKYLMENRCFFFANRLGWISRGRLSV